MSLAKIPFLIVSLLALHVTLTPPNSPPPPKERVKPKGFEALFLTALPWIPFVIKIHFWALASIEMAVILANAHPSLFFSKNILSNLTHAPASHLLITDDFLVASLVASTGGLIRVLSYRTLGQFFTFELSIRQEHKLITSGPYAWVRHPSYTGLLLAGGGAIHCFFTSNASWLQACSSMFSGSEIGSIVAWAWVLVVVVVLGVLWSRISREDEVLKSKFGMDWDEWAKKVPYRLIPGVY